ncbi:hypothetical protein BBJ29_002865 [Phytophthora kernoviae]|uniref:UmuC domain-containing protein n=1 Tax=Phytophthora kernoviae TaxID=325452 RepID=A0A3F2RSQ4_9STRA|nr:hypothetical protein BBP00_00004078 [Phytophthora kernoviae]RLN63620.1 hypothetical protein BBJ29_002865 [Phytophthora kernoviae]
MKFPAAGDGTKRARVIIHLDLDCFYAQVEQRRLKIPDGEPVAAQQWGSLLAVNYVARKFGVERGDFVDDAKKKCPQIHVPHVDTLGENRKPGQLYDRTHQKAILRRYRVASREIFAVLGSIVSVAEKASIDEAFMDVTEMAQERLAQMELTKYVGHETASFVHQICQGNDGNEPVEEKKVLVKMLGCVKQFDQRSGSALVRIEQLEYWVRLLCEEMVMRCEDERIENKRFPSQLTIQFTRTGLEEKPRTRKLGIALDTTVYELYTAAMNVMRLHLDSVFPCAALSMHAKNFHALDSKAVTTISTFFTRNSEHIAQRMEGDTKQFAARGKRDRDGSMSTSPQKLSKQKISAFFSSSNGYSNVAAPALTPPVTHGSNVGLSGGETMSVSNIAASISHFCEECQRTISEPRAEHADFHFALNLSQAQRSEVMASSSAPTKKRGPLDAFLKR